ncbi:MAG: hypothetical protein O3B47_04675 [bacterium]|nr:hypothetical protein [bacterium]
MTREHLQKSIIKLLITSSVPEHYKRMLETLLPVMDLETLQATYDPLLIEQKKMAQLAQKKIRVEHKYRVMVEKVADIELNK